ncbi:Sec-independent protein translocase protein TatB [Salinisphaera aquimarina]|uniref:Sec-independent protein translocase protein TatB n=1 Tax=Salinisphaera aquimarina TaxID=2094031 RepID=A0ABV7EIR4_9GAMM
MFDIGFWELALMAVIGLIVLGPERLPVVARTLGTWVGRAKGYVRGLTTELEREINVDDLRSQVREAREQIESNTRSTADSVKNAVERPAPQPSETPSVMTEQPAADADSAGSGNDAPANPVADAARHDEDEQRP